MLTFYGVAGCLENCGDGLIVSRMANLLRTVRWCTLALARCHTAGNVRTGPRGQESAASIHAGVDKMFREFVSSLRGYVVVQFISSGNG